MALGPVLSLSWVVPSARLCNALFFWASRLLGILLSPALLGAHFSGLVFPLPFPTVVLLTLCPAPGQEPKHSPPPPSASSSFLPRLSSHLSVHTLLPSSISILFSPFPLSSYLTHLAHFVENSFSRGPCFTTLQLVLRCRLRSDSPSLADYFLADDVRCSSNKLIL